MAQYLVSMMPKPKYRSMMHTIIVVVEAADKADALRVARHAGKQGLEDWLNPGQDYNQPKAELLRQDYIYRF